MECAFTLSSKDKMTKTETLVFRNVESREKYRWISEQNESAKTRK